MINERKNIEEPHVEIEKSNRVSSLSGQFGLRVPDKASVGDAKEEDATLDVLARAKVPEKSFLEEQV